jgi:hypothetical protein
MDIPENVANPELYKKAKKLADETYKRHSAYKSMFLVNQYKKLGGKYKNGKKVKGVNRWNKEKWIQVIPYLESGVQAPCGAGDNKKACRPMKKVDSETPITLPELIKIHGKKKLLELARQKRANMDRRINWRLGKIY